MVRLRSERWYSSGGQQKSRTLVAKRSNGSRRLVSLCFLLALVILLMQRAADPQHINNFFSALGVPLDQPQTTDSTVEDAGNSSKPAQLGVWQSTCRDMIPRLLKNATSTQRDQIVTCWFGVANDQKLATLDGLETLQSESFAELDRIAAGTVKEEWQVALDRFREEWSTLWNTPAAQLRAAAPDSNGLSAEFTKELTDYLDRAAMASLEDASAWQRGERVSFWRLLQRTSDESADLGTAPRISTLQLDAESRQYKGKAIRFRGSVRRIEYVERSDSNFGLDGYWLLWLRGQDRSTQPVAVYATDPQLASLENRIVEEEGTFPSVSLTGWAGKRLAYASSAGVQVAPTIFAHSIQFSEVAKNRPEDNNVSVNASDAGWAFGLGAVLAIVILVPILMNWRSKYRSIRRRPPRSPSSSGMLLLVALGSAALVSPAHAQSDTSAQQPPWAVEDESQQALQRLIQTRIVDVVDSALIAQFEDYDGTNVPPDEVLQLALHVRQLGWQRIDTVDAQVAGATQIAGRRLGGTVVSVQQIPLTNDQRSWFLRSQKEQLYAVHIIPEGMLATENQRPITVLSTSIPTFWQSHESLRQPCTIEGLVLQNVSQGLSTEDPPTPGYPTRPIAAIANHIGWTFDADSLQSCTPQLPTHLHAWALLGWDLSHVETIAGAMKQPLQADEAGGFYSLLQKIADQPETILAALDSRKSLPLEGLAKPTGMIGQSIDWPVRLVTCSRVPVSDPQAIQTLGGEHYFQYDGLVDLGNKTVTYMITDGEGKQDQVVFEREFPITIVAKKQLMALAPDGENAQSDAMQSQTWEINRYAKVKGSFYRLWAYESRLLERRGSKSRQTAPLVMGAQLVDAFPPARGASTEVGWFGYALCLATLVILAAVLYLSLRKEPSLRRN